MRLFTTIRAAYWKRDPGPCIICSHPACACVGEAGNVSVVPSTRYHQPKLAQEQPPPTPPPETFSTVTYRETVNRKSRSRRRDG
jgi:hypothetical protein